MGHEYLNCNIKEPSGLVNPTIVVDMPAGESPALYNYCYITQFQRHYYVTDWTNERGLWVAKLKCDVLASWKDYIGAERLYILRAENAYNGEITDTLYPATTDDYLALVSGTDLFTDNLNDGTYVMGIINSDNDGAGAVTYYATDKSTFAQIMHSLLGNTNWMDIDSIEAGLQKGLINPLQYFASVQYFPFRYRRGTQVSTLDFGWWPGLFKATAGTILAYRLDATNPVVTFTNRWTLPNHPQITRGSYLNFPPFCNMYLDFQPFGYIPLDVSAVRANGAGTLFAIVDVDMISGIGSLRLVSGSGSSTGVLDHVQAKVSCDIPLAQISTNLAGIAGGVGGAISSAAGKQWLGTGEGIMSAVVNAIVPRVGQTGSYSGALSVYKGTPQLTTQFFNIVDEDISHQGRPLCEVRTPQSLGGYMIVENGDIHAPATGDELAAIRQYLESGFYYE
jgi:hypothetical protein